MSYLVCHHGAHHYLICTVLYRGGLREVIFVVLSVIKAYNRTKLRAIAIRV